MKFRERSISLVLAALLAISPLDVLALTSETGGETVNLETTVPETTIPETTVPETTIPETTVPETTVPETTVPETTAPEMDPTTAETDPHTEEETTEPTAAETIEMAKLLEASAADSAVLYPGTSEHISTSGTATLQTYVDHDGKTHSIYWASGITPPSMIGANSFHNFTVMKEMGYTRLQAPYENGHGYYDLNKTETNGLCYLGTASNLIYWWLDQNSDYLTRYMKEVESPSGRFQQLPELAPISSQENWKAFLDRPKPDKVNSNYISQKLLTAELVNYAFHNNHLRPDRRHTGFRVDLVHDFFFNGYQAIPKGSDNPTNDLSQYQPDKDGGFFFPIFGKEKLTSFYGGGGYEYYKQNLKKYFTNGIGVGFSVVSIGATHAISIWGAEYDEQGELVRIYATDTDDYDDFVSGNPKYAQALHGYDVQKAPNGDMYLNNRDDKSKPAGYKINGSYTLDLGRDAWEKAFSDPAPKPAAPNITGGPDGRKYNAGDTPEALKVHAVLADADQPSWAFLKYQWYEADDKAGSNARPIAGATGSSYTPSLGSAPETRYYFCRVTAVKYGNTTTIDSPVAAVEVTKETLVHAETPKVNFPYREYHVHQNDTLTISVTASVQDGGTLSYQWYRRDFSSLGGFQPVPGATERTITVPTDQQGEFGYKCLVTNYNASQLITGSRTASLMTERYQKVFVGKSRVPQTPIVITGVPQAPAYGTSFTPSFTGGSGTGSQVWSVEGAAALQPDGSILVTEVGTITITLTIAESGDYEKAVGTKIVTSVKAVPDVGTVPDPGNLTHKTDIGNLVLSHSGSTPGKVQLVKGTVLKVGTASYPWVFTPEDTAHYQQAKGQVQLTVQRAPKTEVTISAQGTRDAYTGKAQKGFENLTFTPSWKGNLSVSYRSADGESLSAAPKDAGSYQVILSIPDSDEDYSGSAVIDFKILPAPLTVSQVRLKDRIYDGSRDAEVMEVIFQGLVPGETLTLSKDYTAKAVYDTPDAGENKRAVLSLVLAEHVKNYVLENAAAEVAGNILRAPIAEVSLGLTAPVVGQTPETERKGEHWSAEISWTPSHDSFRFDVSYEAAVSISPAENYCFADKTLVDGKQETLQGENLTLTRKFAAIPSPYLGVEVSSISGIGSMDTLWVDGAPMAVQKKGEGYYLDLPKDHGLQVIETFSFEKSQDSKPHENYPNGMQVYLLQEDGHLTEIQELRNLLNYRGMSIRYEGKRGIRMITGLDSALKETLVQTGLHGWTLEEYGTAAAWVKELNPGAEPVLGTKGTRENYAYRKGVADPVFKVDGSEVQYTNVLVGFSLEECGLDIALRSYLKLKNQDGQVITLYGGTLIRSIGYVAYQNRHYFDPGTEAYEFVWEMIHAAYGDQFDSEYEG